MSDVFNETDAELTLTIEEQAGGAVGAVANNLNTTVEGYVLDARQGKALDDKKLDKSHVVNNLVTIEEGWALDARQGKWLNENKVGFSDIANDLTTTAANKVLDARQGKALKDAIDKLTSSDETSLQSQITANKTAIAANKTEIAKKISKKNTSVFLQTANWTTNDAGRIVQTVTVEGVTANNTVIVSASPATYVAYNSCQVRCGSQNTNSLTFIAAKKPTIRLNVFILILE